MTPRIAAGTLLLTKRYKYGIYSIARRVPITRAEVKRRKLAKVFVVDDEPAMRRTVTIRLRLAGHEVALQAGRLPEALNELTKIKELGVSVAIVDGAFPDREDGASLAIALRAETPCVKIISLSGEDDRQAWGDRNLKKPDDIIDLVRAVQEVLES